MSIQNLQARQIINVLHDVGVPAHLIGYEYLKHAISLVMSNKEYQRHITTMLYPVIAEANKATSARVERGIRHAIEVACTYSEYAPTYSKLFYTCPGKPTNAQFIATLVEEIELRNLEGLK